MFGTPATLFGSVDRSVTSANIREKFVEGQEIEVRVLEANPETNKMSLSMISEDAKLGGFRGCRIDKTVCRQGGRYLRQ